MSLPSDFEPIYRDREISGDECVHESDLDFIDVSDVSTDSSGESSNDFQDNKCAIFTYTVKKRLIYSSNKYDSFVELVNNTNFGL